MPRNFDEIKFIGSISPNKDIDGFHPDNVKKFLAGQKTDIIPGLNLGIAQLLASTGENLANKKTLIIARSVEFTQTLSHLLKELAIASEAAEPDSPNVKIKSQNADIVITAAGRPYWLKADDIKQGAIIIDVGTSRLDEETIAGDVDFEQIAAKAGWITPVPGGVGPMTVAMLLKNAVALAVIHRQKLRNN